MQKLGVPSPATIGIAVHHPTWGEALITVEHALDDGKVLQPANIDLVDRDRPNASGPNSAVVGTHRLSHMGISLIALEAGTEADVGRIVELPSRVTGIASQNEYTSLSTGERVVMFGRSSARVDGEIVRSPGRYEQVKIRPIPRHAGDALVSTAVGDSGAPWIANETTSPTIIGLHNQADSNEGYAFARPLWSAVNQWRFSLSP